VFIVVRIYFVIDSVRQSENFWIHVRLSLCFSVQISQPYKLWDSCSIIYFESRLSLDEIQFSKHRSEFPNFVKYYLFF